MRTRLIPSGERGAALALTLIALVVVGALVGGSFLIALLDRRSGETALRAAQALGAAEAGLDQAMTAWRATNHASMTVGATRSLGAGTLTGGASHSDTLTRLGGTLFLLRSVGKSRVGSVFARAQVARFIRLDPAGLDGKAAVATLEGAAVGGSSRVDGADSLPLGWGLLCPPPDTIGVAGIRDSMGSVTFSGSCSGGSCVSGHPPVQPDSTLGGLALTQLGAQSFAGLFAAADVTVGGVVTGVAPRVAGSVCEQSDSLNWGEPLPTAGHPCRNYFPVIAAQGGTVLGSGRGQGLLLVNGDLEVSGGFEFFGPMVILGTLNGSGAGGRLSGAVLARRVMLSDHTEVRFSRCAVSRALAGSARPRPIRERSWSRLY